MKKRKQTTVAHDSYFADTIHNLLSHRLALLGMIVLALMILAVIFLPYILDLDPYKSYVEGGFNQKPSAEHWLGTDRTGRDLFARLVYGGRVSLTVGVLSTLVAMAIGIPLGLLAGYYRGVLEVIIMRCADIFMSFPSLVCISVLSELPGGLFQAPGRSGHNQGLPAELVHLELACGRLILFVLLKDIDISNPGFDLIHIA